MKSVFFLNFKLVFEILAESRKIFKRIATSEVWIFDQIAMCYISMDLSQQALQTNGKFFSF